MSDHSKCIEELEFVILERDNFESAARHFEEQFQLVLLERDNFAAAARIFESLVLQLEEELAGYRSSESLSDDS